jgi:hypothetical protein
MNHVRAVQWDRAGGGKVLVNVGMRLIRVELWEMWEKF